jgi:hypothetical protein
MRRTVRPLANAQKKKTRPDGRVSSHTAHNGAMWDSPTSQNVFSEVNPTPGV